MDKRILAFFIALLAVFAYQLFFAGSGDALDYYTDWEDAVREAKLSGKPILLNFGGPW